MATILIVEKTGTIKESSVKKWDEDELYKKAGFKTKEGFTMAHQWTHGADNVISLYGKTTGRAGQENKYDFPPPVDTVLFFGACILTSSKGVLKKSQWDKIYEDLFGGFEDIGDEDSEEEEDTDDDLPRTKDGYVKDGFIVDEDDEEEEDEEDEEDEDDEEEEIIAPPKKSAKPKAKKSKLTVFEKIDTQEVEGLDCTSELEAELYEE
jgi:hypothetical protein